MSYSEEIQKLNSSLSSISAVNLDPKFDTWEGTAKTKQVANVNNLKSTLDSQTGMVKTLIDALTAIDDYDTNKSEYDKF